MNIHKKAFTLIEILVVVAIIAILAGILFPVFARARESARRASCQSNLKQFGLAMQQYVQDYDGFYPYVPEGEGISTGRAKMGTGDFPDGEYQGDPPVNRWDAGPVVKLLMPYTKSEQLAFCPSVDKVNPDLTPNTNYEASAYIFADTSKELKDDNPYVGQAILESVIVDPSNTMIFQDYKGDNSRPHLDGFNNLAADGRVKWMKSGNSSIKPRYW